MANPRRTLHLQMLAPALLLPFVIFAGCSKKANESSSAAQPTAAAPAPEAQPADASAQAPTGPGLDSSQMVGDAKVAMTEADAAVRQKEYEKAARLLMAIQQAQLSQQQAALAHQQMVSFQRTLANAIASGDPNAMAAGEVLRGSHRR
jgi:hypothetical protein